VPAPNSLLGALESLVGSAALSSRRWIWEQYDHMVMADTVQRPGGDAAVVRVHGTEKGLAISCDVTPRYCAADPREGAKQAVAECWRNLTAVGAEPLAITDCMNFGNPERPEIMGEFVEAVKGMADACTALSFPVVSGNVSLYNETNGRAIHPTPVVGAVGLVPDVRRVPKGWRTGDVVLLAEASAISLAGSELQARYGEVAGSPPRLDLVAEARLVALLWRAAPLCTHVHDAAEVRGVFRLAPVEHVGEVAEEPGPAQAAPSHDHPVAAGGAHHPQRVLRFPDVAVA